MSSVKAVVAIWSTTLSIHFASALFLQPHAKLNVTLELYGEAGCPDTRAFILGPWRETLAISGIRDVVDFSYRPWGNSYFVTKSCGGGNAAYNSTVRGCFSDHCNGHAITDLECFQKIDTVVCQHGDAECQANRWTACAGSLLQGEFGDVTSSYIDFVACMAEHYKDYTSAVSSSLRSDSPSIGQSTTAAVEALATHCSAKVGVTEQGMKGCFNGPAGDIALRIAAAATPPHPGVPHVVVDGVFLTESQQPDLLNIVCNAYKTKNKGKLPTGCHQTVQL